MKLLIVEMCIRDRLQDVYLFSNYVLKICKFLAIPIVLIIGLIVIIQKKRDIKLENLKKAIIIIVTSFVTIFIVALVISTVISVSYTHLKALIIAGAILLSILIIGRCV